MWKKKRILFKESIICHFITENIGEKSSKEGAATQLPDVAHILI